MIRPLEIEAVARTAALLVVLMPCACSSDGEDSVVANETALSFSKTLDSDPDEAADVLVVWDVSSGQPDYVYIWGRAAVQFNSFKLDLRSRPPTAAMNSYGLVPRHSGVDGLMAQDFGFVGAARARRNTLCISSTRAGATEPKDKPATHQHRCGEVLGLGHVVVGLRSADLSEGRVSDDDTLFKKLIGASEKHAIIYADHAAANTAIAAMRGTASAEEIKELEEFWLFDFPLGYSCGEARDAEPGQTFDTFVPVDCSKLEVRLGDLEQFEFPNWT